MRERKWMGAGALVVGFAWPVAVAGGTLEQVRGHVEDKEESDDKNGDDNSKKSNGKLERVREETRDSGDSSRDSGTVRGRSEAERRATSSGHSGYDAGEEADDSSIGVAFVGLLVVGVGYVVTSPFWAPYMLLEDDLARPFGLSGYPYAADAPGFVSYQEGDLGRTAALRLSAEYVPQVDRIQRVTGAARLSLSRFELDTSWLRFRETLFAAADDALTVGDVNALVRFAQNERMQFRAGVGVRIMPRPDTPAVGFNFVYDQGRRRRFAPAPPPSEPDRRISRIRLSSQWFLHRGRHAMARASVMVKSPSSAK